MSRASNPRLPVSLPPRPLGTLAALLAVWLLWKPPSPDLAAQVYRVHLFSVSGFALWDNNWYAGHYLPSYSLIFPPLAALVGLRPVGALAVTVSVLAFHRLAVQRFGDRATIATTLFALGACGDLYIGRITFALGVTCGLLSVLALTREHRLASAAMSLCCAAASPVAGAFLVLAAATDLVTNRKPLRAAVLAAPASGLVLALAVLFPEGGYEPFATASLLAALAVSLALYQVLPATERLLRNGTLLYGLALLASYLVHTPMGSNAIRFGVLFVPPALAGCVQVADVQRTLSRWRTRCRLSRRRAHRLGVPRVLATATIGLLGAAMVAWQVIGPLEQSIGASLEAASSYAFYVPAIRFLERHSDGLPMRIEVPFSSSHWDATILGERFDLARGWERQLDTRYDALFYTPHLSAGAYRAWLRETGVRFVVLSDAPMDFSSVQEAALVRRGLPFLRPVFHSANWRIYEVLGAAPLADGPGRLIGIDGDGFTLRATRAGTFLVRVRYTPYWHVSGAFASVSEAAGGWTEVTATRGGAIAVDAQLPLGLRL